MIPELGHYALILAALLAVLQTVVPAVAHARGDGVWLRSAVPFACGQALFVLLAYAALTWSFVVHDFSVHYVASNSNLSLPLAYRISAVWGAHEGSLLLWILVLCGWTVAVAAGSRRQPADFRARVLSVLGGLGLGFLLFLLATSNPFDRTIPPPANGADLNPLLQDPGLIIHPPMLYMGYVGFAVAFAFAIAALWDGRLHSAWARWTRPWVTAAWVFLTLGIALGSWWAYHELGWGGWWFWDPVENASFMPWLVGTALIHSLAVTEKRGTFQRWTVLLSLLAFSLSLLGTFLVRSGVLVSVHAFANDPERGVYILAFLAVVVGGSLLLYAARAHRIDSPGHFELLSRETLLLFNNVLLLIATFAVLLGTLYPLIVDVLGLPTMSVGPPYFNTVFVPLMLPLLFLCALGPMARWKSARVRELLRRVQVPLLLALSVGLAIPLAAFGGGGALVLAGSSLAIWCMAGAIAPSWRHVARMARGAGIGFALGSLPRHMLGMSFAHLGLGVVALGIVLSSAFSEERELLMRPGDAERFAGYTFVYHGERRVEGPNYVATRGHLAVSRDGARVADLYPEQRVYQVQTKPMTEAAIDETIWRDLYAALGPSHPDGARGVRLYVKPMIQWLWGGALLMALGGVLALSDRRYRVRPVARRQT